MRTFNIITSLGTWTIKGNNLYWALKESELSLAARYPNIKIHDIKEINKPFKLNIESQAIKF